MRIEHALSRTGRPRASLATAKLGLVLSTLVLLGGLPACSKKGTHETMTANSATTLYHCAMHPQIVSEKPGECPICHMQLTRILRSEQPRVENTERKILFYRNPMDPSVTSHAPMKDGMGMDYIPVYSQPNVVVAGQAPVHIEPGIEQQIGVRIATVTRQDLSVPIRAAAQVAYDPQLYNASLEHQEAAAFLRKAKAQGSPDLLEQAESTLRSSELRLRQMGLSEEQIADIERPGFDASGLLVGSGRGGKVSVYANVFDTEASLIRRGQAVELTSPAMPGERLEGVVKSIDPILNSDTRTVRVRIEVPHAKGTVRPETYLSATIRASLGRLLTVPESAVVDTGTRQLVYVETQPGTYEPREVRLGRRSADAYEVLSGLQDGERVVSSANFFIDSESRIQAATLKATPQDPR